MACRPVVLAGGVCGTLPCRDGGGGTPRCVPTALQPRRDGLESRQTTIVLEKYGIVWQSTCGVADAGDYPEYEVTFRTMQQSLEIRGVWSTLYAVEGR